MSAAVLDGTAVCPPPPAHVARTPWFWSEDGHTLRPAMPVGRVTAILKLESRGQVENPLSREEFEAACRQLKLAHRAIECVPDMLGLLVDMSNCVDATAWRDRADALLVRILDGAEVES